MSNVSKAITEILNKIDASNMYNQFFSRQEDIKIEKILTSHEEILRDISREWIDIDSYFWCLADQIKEFCGSTISRDTIMDLLIRRNPYEIILFPCKTPCKEVNDFYGFLYATLNNNQKTIFLDLICYNGSFLISLLIFIAKYLSVEYIFLQSMPNSHNFYLKFLFEDIGLYNGSKNKSQYNEVLYKPKGDENLIPMFLDMKIYTNEKLNLLYSRSMKSHKDDVPQLVPI